MHTETSTSQVEAYVLKAFEPSAGFQGWRVELSRKGGPRGGGGGDRYGDRGPPRGGGAGMRSDSKSVLGLCFAYSLQIYG